jgi:pimeloyl-ACP methyl ester carboxylesterase
MKTISRLMLITLISLLLAPAPAICQLLKTGFADIEGRMVYFEVKGQGSAIVLIHGFSLDTRMWDPQFDVLAQYHRVVRYDISGYGRSSVPDSSVSSSSELAALLKTLAIDKAAVIGMSMGGSVAINFTLEHPEMVEALITVGSTLNGYTMREPRASRTERLFSLAGDSGLAVAKENWLNDPFLTPVVHASAIRAKIRQIITEWSGIQFKNRAKVRFVPIRPPAITRLEEIKIPTLAIVGGLDDPNMLAIADTIAARIAQAKKVIVPESGHLLNLERPGEFNKLVLDFLRENVKR